MTTEPSVRLLSVQEVADFLNVTTRTVRRWIEAGDITAYRIGRKWRLTQHDLNTFTEQRRKSAYLYVR